MLKQIEIAKKWGLSKMRISQLVKKGMPLTSWKAAEKWRAGMELKQRPRNRVKGGDDPVGDVGMPIGPRPRKGIVKEVTERKAKVEVKGKGNPKDEGKDDRPKPKELSKTGDSLLDALNEAINVQEMAYQEYMWACRHDSATRASRLMEHVRAMDSRMKTEKMYREELERRKVLVNQVDVLARCRTGVEAVIRRLKRIPNEVGPQCNPQDPIAAAKILEREIAVVIQAGAKAIHDLQPPTT